MTKELNDLPVEVIRKHRLLNNPVVVVLSTIGLFFGAQVVASSIVLLALLLGQQYTQIIDWIEGTAFPTFVFVLISDILIVLGVIKLLKVKGWKLKNIGLAKPQKSDVGRAIVGYLVYLITFIFISIVIKKLVPSLDLEQDQQLGFDAHNKSVVNILLSGVSLVILPPIAEEILCRGYLYSSLKIRYRKVVSAIITSGVFAMAHLQFGSNAPLLWIAGLDTFILSLVLVDLRERTGRLVAPMIIHCIKNLVAFSALFLLTT